MRLFTGVLLWLSLLQASKGHDETESNQLYTRQLKEEYGISTPQVIKLMHDHFYEMQQKIDKHDEEIKRKELEIDIQAKTITQLQNKVDSCTEKDNIINLHETNNKFLRNQFEFLINAMEEQTNNLCGKEVEEISKLKKSIKLGSDKVKELEPQLKFKNETIVNKSKEIESLNQEINKQSKEIIKLKTDANAKSKKLTNCEAKLKKSANELKEFESQLKIKNETIIDKSKEIETMTQEINLLRKSTDKQSKEITELNALLNSDIVYSEWIVIQQRFNGGVDFYRNWTEYKNGFGDFWDGDFFLGLEKIHRLTTEQPHELYIHMQRHNGSITFARYDEFAISNEVDKYELSNLGEFSGNGIDALSYSQSSKFSTFDENNDIDDYNCAERMHGGWWYKNCAKCNLNGKYFNANGEIGSNFWESWEPLKLVKMMIRQIKKD